jgi:geranylgeranyl pyrophosphate synthase
MHSVSTSGQVVEQTLRIYEDAGVKRAAEEEIERLTNKALDCIADFPANEATEALRAIAHKLINRKS